MCVPYIESEEDRPFPHENDGDNYDDVILEYIFVCGNFP